MMWNVYVKSWSGRSLLRLFFVCFKTRSQCKIMKSNIATCYSWFAWCKAEVVFRNRNVKAVNYIPSLWKIDCSYMMNVQRTKMFSIVCASAWHDIIILHAVEELPRTRPSIFVKLDVTAHTPCYGKVVVSSSTIGTLEE